MNGGYGPSTESITSGNYQLLYVARYMGAKIIPLGSSALIIV